MELFQKFLEIDLFFFVVVVFSLTKNIVHYAISLGYKYDMYNPLYAL